jgi:hypothetical protein
VIGSFAKFVFVSVVDRLKTRCKSMSALFMIDLQSRQRARMPCSRYEHRIGVWIAVRIHYEV